MMFDEIEKQIRRYERPSIFILPCCFSMQLWADMRSYLQHQKVLDIRMIEVVLSLSTLFMVVYTLVIIVTMLQVRLAVCGR